MSFCASAQRDNFFNDWDDVSNGLDKINTFDNLDKGPVLPGHGGGDTPAPLGSGLIVLTALGAGYALTKKRD